MTDTATELEAMLAAARYKDHECSWKAIPMEPCHVCDATALAQLRLEGCTPELARCALKLDSLLDCFLDDVACEDTSDQRKPCERCMRCRIRVARQALADLAAAVKVQRRG